MICCYYLFCMEEALQGHFFCKLHYDLYTCVVPHCYNKVNHKVFLCPRHQIKNKRDPRELLVRAHLNYSHQLTQKLVESVKR